MAAKKKELDNNLDTVFATISKIKSKLLIIRSNTVDEGLRDSYLSLYKELEDAYSALEQYIIEIKEK